MDKTQLLTELVGNQQTRRGFAKRIGAIGAGIAGTTLLGGSIVSAVAQTTNVDPSSTTITDTDILNFALNLEYLEAEFYTYATNGASIEQEGVIPSSAVGGPTTGGHMVPNIAKSPAAYIASALRYDEQAHVKFLRSALGSSAVKKPTINLNALGMGFSNWQQFFVLARAFEDVGVSAYGGAAGLISNKTYLEAAARIAETESMHSGAIREFVINNGIPTKPVDSLDVIPSPSHPFFVDQYALAIPRSTSQVLKIVYGGGTTKGGFFPDGMNGKIKTA
jgi:hypothetical protein